MRDPDSIDFVDDEPLTPFFVNFGARMALESDDDANAEFELLREE